MTNESKRDWEKFFKPEDFGPLIYSGRDADYIVHMEDLIAERANEIIKKEPEKAPRVYGWFDAERSFSSDGTDGSGSHTARLIQIEEIKRD